MSYSRLLNCLLPVLFLCLSSQVVRAQKISFRDTIDNYNTRTLKLNRTGFALLGGWGLVSLFAGGIGYLATPKGESRYFFETTAVCGAVNTGMAAAGLIRLRSIGGARLSYDGAYSYYRDSKKAHLLSAGVDILAIGAGVGLTAYGQHQQANGTRESGIGKSLVVQGVFSLLMDDIMFSALQLENSKWYRIMNEIRFSSQTIGFNYTF